MFNHELESTRVIMMETSNGVKTIKYSDGVETVYEYDDDAVNGFTLAFEVFDGFSNKQIGGWKLEDKLVEIFNILIEDVELKKAYNSYIKNEGIIFMKLSEIPLPKGLKKKARIVFALLYKLWLTHKKETLSFSNLTKE